MAWSGSTGMTTDRPTEVGASARADVPGLDEDKRAFVEGWSRAYRYNPYRNYPLISAAAGARVLADAVLEAGPEVTCLWHYDGARPAGLIRIVELPWDTALFGLRMGRISHVCGDLSGELLKTLLEETAFDHLAVRVDASDLAAQRVLTQAGFFPVDSLLTYLYRPDLGDLPEAPPGRTTRRYLYRQYEPADRDSILRITARCYARYPGRYHADPWLEEHSTERYVHWAEKCVDGEADQICVSESNGRVVGFIAFRYDRRLYRSLALGCYGGAALGASLGGDYHNLLRYTLMCPKAIPMQFAECQTQIDNFTVHHIYQNLKLQYVRAEHTYHRHQK